MLLICAFASWLHLVCGLSRQSTSQVLKFLDNLVSLALPRLYARFVVPSVMRNMIWNHSPKSAFNVRPPAASHVPHESSSDGSFPQELVNAINFSAKVQTPGTSGPELDSLAKDLAELLNLYDLILAEEKPGLGMKRSQQLDSFNDGSRIVCDFCECDIFQSFFECRRCAGGSFRSLIVCPGCYSEGRSCRCETMEPMQRRNFLTLMDTRKEAADVLQRFFGKTGGDT